MNTEDIYDMRYAYDITQDIFPTTSYAGYRAYLDERRGVTLNSPARHIEPQYTASFSASLDDNVLKWLKEFNWEYQPTFELNNLTDELSDIAEIEWGDPVPFKQNDEVETSSYETGELDSFINTFEIIEDDNT